MTFRELYEQACKVIPPTQSVCVEVEVFNHRAHSGQVIVQYSIWDGERHFQGPSPDEALASCRTHYAESAETAEGACDRVDAAPLPLPSGCGG